MRFVGCLMITLLLLSVYETVKRECVTSLLTRQVTPRCPRTKDERDRRAKQFNCSSYTQNCTSPSLFDYHCVSNAWQNESLEVCAIKTNITGQKCPEFNIGGRRVQEHDNGTCSLCPFRYKSTEAYKYRECYSYENNQATEKENSDENGIENKTNLPTCYDSECSDADVQWMIIVILSVILLVVVVVVLVRWIRKRTTENTRNMGDIGSSENTTAEGEPLSPTSNSSDEKTTEGKDTFSQIEHIDRGYTADPDDALHKGFFSRDGRTPAIPKSINKSSSSVHEPAAFHKPNDNVESSLK